MEVCEQTCPGKRFVILGGKLLGLCLRCSRLDDAGEMAPEARQDERRVWWCMNWRE